MIADEPAGKLQLGARGLGELQNVIEVVLFNASIAILSSTLPSHTLESSAMPATKQRPQAQDLTARVFRTLDAVSLSQAPLPRLLLDLPHAAGSRSPVERDGRAEQERGKDPAKIQVGSCKCLTESTIA